MMLNNIDSDYLIENIHEACFDTSTSCKKKVFYLMPATTDLIVCDALPKIICLVSMKEPSLTSRLDITFVIQNVSDAIEIPTFHIENAKHTDFLWENNCLELFIADKNSSYYEINASFDGKFAVYEFEDYRNPSTLPPRKSSDLTFQWRNTNKQKDLIYQFSLLISKSARFTFADIDALNPCVILYQNSEGKKEPIFYAVSHANPPDFHDKNYWSNF